MQAILLAAGRSQRLAPIRDKNLLEFCGKTLVEHQVCLIKNAKIRDVVVVGNAENLEALKRIFKKYNNVAVTEQKDLEEGMAGGVLAGAKRVNQKSILVMSTNDIVDLAALETIQETMRDKTASGAILAKKTARYFPGGYLKLDSKGFVAAVIEKPGEGNEPSRLINLVLHAYADFPQFVHILSREKGKADGRYEAALTRYIQDGKARMKAAAYQGYWQPIKYPWHILEAMNYFLTRQKKFIDKTAEISPRATIKGDVYVGKNARIFENAVIQGPAYIGDGVIVGNNALVRGSMVGRGSVVGFCTEVARSYLHSDVWTHSNYIGDSIIDRNVSFGAGAVTGNLRLDDAEIPMTMGAERVGTGLTKLGAMIGSDCRFGIHTSLMPGVRIGRGSFVGGGVVVAHDIPDGSFATMETKLQIRRNTKTASAEERGKMRKRLS